MSQPGYRSPHSGTHSRHAYHLTQYWNMTENLESHGTNVQLHGSGTRDSSTRGMGHELQILHASMTHHCHIRDSASSEAISCGYRVILRSIADSFGHIPASHLSVSEHVADFRDHPDRRNAPVLCEVISLGHGFMREDTKLLRICGCRIEKDTHVM